MDGTPNYGNGNTDEQAAIDQPVGGQAPGSGAEKDSPLKPAAALPPPPGTVREKRPRSPAQNESSRVNGSRSRGPTTPQGIANSSQNAVKHGQRAKGLPVHLLSPEEMAEHKRLRDQLIHDLKPQGVLEEHLVEDLANLITKKRRVGLGEAALMIDPSPEPESFCITYRVAPGSGSDSKNAHRVIEKTVRLGSEQELELAESIDAALRNYTGIVLEAEAFEAVWPLLFHTIGNIERQGPGTLISTGVGRKENWIAGLAHPEVIPPRLLPLFSQIATQALDLSRRANSGTADLRSTRQMLSNLPSLKLLQEYGLRNDRALAKNLETLFALQRKRELQNADDDLIPEIIDVIPEVSDGPNELAQ